MFKPLRISHLMFMLAALLSITMACRNSEPERIVASYSENYAIDPDTLLEGLAEGRTDVFIPQEETPYQASPTLGEPVQWQPEDYFQIAQAVHELGWGESLENWDLHGVDFGIDCAYLEHGPQDAWFSYFKTVKLREQETRLVSDIIIEPRRKTVAGGRVEYYPQRKRWQTIDFAHLKISAEDALQIAETHGGYETRTAVANECYISIGLYSDSFEYGGWQVDYIPNSGSEVSLGLYKIDPETGELENKK